MFQVLWLLLAAGSALANSGCGKGYTSLLLPEGEGAAYLERFEDALAELRARVEEVKKANEGRPPAEQRKLDKDPPVIAANDALLEAASALLAREGIRTMKFTMSGRHAVLSLHIGPEPGLARLAGGLLRRFDYNLIYDPLTNVAERYLAFELGSRMMIGISDDTIRHARVVQELRHEIRHAYLSTLPFEPAGPLRQEIPLLAWLTPVGGDLDVSGYEKRARLDELATHVADLMDFSTELRRLHAEHERERAALGLVEERLALALSRRAKILDRARGMSAAPSLALLERDAALVQQGEKIERLREERAGAIGAEVLARVRRETKPLREFLAPESFLHMRRVETLGGELRAFADQYLGADQPGPFALSYDEREARGARWALRGTFGEGVALRLRARGGGQLVEVSAVVKLPSGKKRQLEFSLYDPRLYFAYSSAVRDAEVRATAAAEEGGEAAPVNMEAPGLRAVLTRVQERMRQYQSVGRQAEEGARRLRLAYEQGRAEEYLKELRALRRVLWAAYRPGAGASIASP